MPPLPSSEMIWYEPSCVPIVTDKYNSLLSCVELRGLYKSVNTRSMEWARHAFAACCQPTPPGSLHNSIQQGSFGAGSKQPCLSQGGESRSANGSVNRP